MTDTTNGVHHAAAQGYAVAAGTYARGRPDYPSEIVDWLSTRLGLSEGKMVVDLGAGTGKFTARLVETGARVIAVEPVAEMRQTLMAALPQVEACPGTAESIPLSDQSVDAVVCAQSFHWFATPATLIEILRILKPGGKLGLVWNMRDGQISWVAHLNRIVNALERDAPRYQSGAWRTLFPFEGFGPLEERHFSHSHTGTPEDVILNRVRSTSFIAVLPAEKRTDIDNEIRALIAAEPTLAGKDVVTVPYVTAAFSAVKMA